MSPRALGLGPTATLVLGLLLLADLLLVTLHLSRGLLGEPSAFEFDLGVERGYGEFLQYVKGIWTFALLVLLVVRWTSSVLLVWAGVCAVLVADDVFQLHERAGQRVAADAGLHDRLGPLAGHAGELLYLAAVGLVALPALVLSHRRSAGPARRLSRYLFLLFAALVVAGVVLDALHAPVLELWPGSVADVLMTAVEDGGELVVMSVITATVLAAAGLAVGPAAPEGQGGRPAGQPTDSPAYRPMGSVVTRARET